MSLKGACAVSADDPAVGRNPAGGRSRAAGRSPGADANPAAGTNPAAGRIPGAGKSPEGSQGSGAGPGSGAGQGSGGRKGSGVGRSPGAPGDAAFGNGPVGAQGSAADSPGAGPAVNAAGPAVNRETNARGAALAREKLAQAKADAAKRGQLPRSEPRRRSRGARRESGDPQLFGRAIAELLAARGWEQSVAVGGVFGRWADIVGPELAAHTKPESFTDGEVVVVADSTAWATQVRLLARTLVRRLNEELGDGTVRSVKVRGPMNAPRPSGGLRVTGSRGPRDTYG
jgi:predicted nucleic acid-binding Zn ribbon protein